MTSTTDATPTVLSISAESQATYPVVAPTPTTTVDPSLYGPAPSNFNPTTADSSVPDEMLIVHTTANT